MPHKLEKYLKEKRPDLDVDIPDYDSVWSRIQMVINTEGKRKDRKDKRYLLIRIRNIAAAVFILFSLGYIANDIINGFSSRKVSLATIDWEMGIREKEYKEMVKLRLEEVKQYRNSDNVIINEIFDELTRLDTIYVQSISDLKTLGPNEKVINTVFDIYEQKIHLLELIILETNKLNIHENNEKILL